MGLGTLLVYGKRHNREFKNHSEKPNLILFSSYERYFYMDSWWGLHKNMLHSLDWADYGSKSYRILILVVGVFIELG